MLLLVQQLKLLKLLLQLLLQFQTLHNECFWHVLTLEQQLLHLLMLLLLLFPLLLLLLLLLQLLPLLLMSGLHPLA